MEKIFNVLNNLCNYMNLNNYLLIGGNNRREDIANLDKNGSVALFNAIVDVLGTPPGIFATQ